MQSFDQIETLFRQILPPCDGWTMRLLKQDRQYWLQRDAALLAPQLSTDIGIHIEIMHGAGHGWAATDDLSESGLRSCILSALQRAESASQFALFTYPIESLPTHQFGQDDRAEKPTSELIIETLSRSERALAGHHSAINSSQASLHFIENQQFYCNSAGAHILQKWTTIQPCQRVSAHLDGEVQSRSWLANGSMRRGGWEQLQDLGWETAGAEISEEVIALCQAQECPNMTGSLIIQPAQMLLQIHESIGHPLELDRILGDERNYAGGSFVSPDMFGSYRYGSDLLNIVFDRSFDQQNCSAHFDDAGQKLETQYLIKNGILERPIGSAVSAQRCKELFPKDLKDFNGTANSRSCNWNRPVNDRMVNINLACGMSSLEEMISDIEDGIMVDSNRSWSIDDQRNKFQFGCEVGKRIQNGKITGYVKNPNYRGISAEFWRSLDAVGDESTLEVLGINNCGKAEPNQVITVGHASPACRFQNIDIFGGAA